MLWKRILTALAGIPLFVLITYQGGWLLTAALLILTALAASELLALYRRQIELCADTVYVAAFLGLGSVYFPERGKAFVFIVLIYALARELAAKKRQPLVRPALAVFSGAYTGWLLGHFHLLRSISGGGFALLLLAVVATWITDTGAYFIGTAIGKQKLAPSISPKKSVEGAVGGFVLAVIVTPLLGMALGVSAATGVVCGAVASISGQFGDLVESSLKRQAEVKDSGQLFPGHGGVLDRFDSLLFSIPSVYYVFLWLN